MEIIYKDDNGSHITIKEEGCKDIYEMQEILERLLLAIGYHQESIDSIFGRLEDKEL